MHRKKKTKIVATIGPASESVKTLTTMMQSGLNVVRMNFSHEDHVTHGKRLKNVRVAAKKTGKYVAVLFDLGGPKIRTGDFEDGEVTLTKNQKFTFTTKKCFGNTTRVSVSYKKLPREVKEGSVILLDDGTKKFVVESIVGTEVMTRVVNGGRIKSRRGVNVPGANLSISSLTAKDKQDVLFGIAQDVDFFALSFVRSAKDIMQLRRILDAHKSQAKIIAKIETQEAVQDIDAIIAAADGIMVARGDLAVEVGPEHVPHLQKEIIIKCNIIAKPVIVATQMLESMISVSVPTRAEVNDVTNAILDGTDAIMLSAETAIGSYVEETIAVMRDIALRTEREPYFRARISDIHARAVREKVVVDAVTLSVVHAAFDVHARAIVALTESGFTAQHISRYRPAQPIIALSPHEQICRQLMLSFGCYPQKITGFKSIAHALSIAKKVLAQERIVRKGDHVVVSAGIPFGKSGTTNMMIIEEM